MYKPGKAHLGALSIIWSRVYDQYIDRFGMNDDFISYLMKQREISIMKIDRWLNDDRSLETLIDVAELELKEITENGGSDFFETKSAMEKELGFMIDVKKCSVTEFYSYIRLLNKPKKSNG